ncbi:hypothetical protein AMST5_00994 [freshwater sediment metagenome]|jgi:hypothetical protein|uniref:Uncharacterized protein n=1 Tax=freshwater sediment metagenome TaxID=556182 RepID=A0AA48M037_9ZZZZ
MFRPLCRLAIAVALFGSSIAAASDLDRRPDPRQDRNPVADAPPDVIVGDVLFWRAYGWPGGQAGPCWRLWYGQWIWSC